MKIIPKTPTNGLDHIWFLYGSEKFLVRTGIDRTNKSKSLGFPRQSYRFKGTFKLIRSLVGYESTLHGIIL